VDQANFTRLAQVRTSQLQGYAQDGLGRAVAEGIVDPQPPINWADPATLNSRVTAAAGVSTQRGYAVSPFNRADLEAGVQQFERATPDARLAMVQSIASIDDPQVRSAAFQHFERARGEGGRLPAGTLVRVADMLRDGSIEVQQAARRMIGNRGADVSDRARVAGESAELRAALVSAQGRGVQAALVGAANVAGGGQFSALVSRDMDIIRRDAAARMAAGEAAERAVAAAQRDLNAGRGSVNDASLGQVYFPAQAGTTEQVTVGMRALREQAASVPVDPSADAEANLQARARQSAARSATWINEGDRYALVARGQAGAPTVIRTATLAEITGAAQTNARRDAADPPVMRRERALEQERRGQRQAPPAPNPVPDVQ
jgi:hypothetical protein